MPADTNLIKAVEQHVTEHFRKNVPAEFVYHDLQHTRNVVDAVVAIAENYQLDQQSIDVLQIAAWFHDSGYDKGAKDHEQRGCEYARAYFSQLDFSKEDLENVCACILATKPPQDPKNLLQQILCDADLSHLGRKTYWDRCGRVRQEMLITKSIVMSEQEWVEFELEFMQKHHYHTPIAIQLFQKRKDKHIKQLKKQKLRLNPQEVLTVEEVAKRDKKKKKKGNLILPNSKNDINQLNLGRGVETMYRTTYRTHINLSSIADNKANIMLSINAIIISIIISTLVPSFETNTKLIFPTLLMLVVCLGAMVFAILSTRPKITEGKFTRDDIENKKSNLLFFGNFYNMSLDDFHWGMMEMIKDKDFLYSSMTRDLYFLGVVLAKKYKYLRVCYSIFMYGLIVTVLAFSIAFLM